MALDGIRLPFGAAVFVCGWSRLSVSLGCATGGSGATRDLSRGGAPQGG